MGLLDILMSPKEFLLDDKKFDKLTMSEAKMPQWISLEDQHRAARPIMPYLFGEDWAKLPFKSALDILNFRFGDTFLDKTKPFDFDSWNVLLHLVLNLNPAQKKFLKEHNFLPHKYTATKERLELLKQRLKSITISIEEFTNSGQQDMLEKTNAEYNTVLVECDKAEKFMKQWEDSNPLGGNPADASEYISDAFELREWEKENPQITNQKHQMFVIMTKQMITALEQARRGKAFHMQEFGHQDEIESRVKARQKEEKRKSKLRGPGHVSVTPGTNKTTKGQTNPQSKKSTQTRPVKEKPKQSHFQQRLAEMQKQKRENQQKQEQHKPKAIITTAKSSKFQERLKDAQEKQAEEKEETTPIEVVASKPVVEEKPKAQSFSDILAEKKELDKKEQEKSETKSEPEEESTFSQVSEVDAIRARVLEKQEKGESTVVKKKKPLSFKVIAIGVIVAITVATVLYLTL